jgi:hypothetical protein
MVVDVVLGDELVHRGKIAFVDLFVKRSHECLVALFSRHEGVLRLPRPGDKYLAGPLWPLAG